MDILSTILTGPVGALFGAAGAIATKVIDYKAKQLDHAHELALRDKDRELAALEFEHKSVLAREEADAQIAFRELDAVAASVAADRATYGDSLTGRIVDLVRGLIRPTITLLSMALVGWLTLQALRGGADLTPEQRMELLRESLFLSGTAIAWWFGARSNLGRGKR